MQSAMIRLSVTVSSFISFLLLAQFAVAVAEAVLDGHPGVASGCRIWSSTSRLARFKWLPIAVSGRRLCAPSGVHCPR
jgi:hypothetical protein